MTKNKGIRKPKIPIYDLKFFFYRDKVLDHNVESNEKIVGFVDIRYRPFKKGPEVKRKLPIPDYIEINELSWTRKKIWPRKTNDVVASYFRVVGNNGVDYYDESRQSVSTRLGQNLERCFLESLRSRIEEVRQFKK